MVTSSNRVGAGLHETGMGMSRNGVGVNPAGSSPIDSALMDRRGDLDLVLVDRGQDIGATADATR